MAIDLNGHILTFILPLQITVDAPNFVYQDPILTISIPAKDILSEILDSKFRLAKCYCCTLTVSVPKSPLLDTESRTYNSSSGFPLTGLRLGYVGGL
jgi:hypothetical protein